METKGDRRRRKLVLLADGTKGGLAAVAKKAGLSLPSLTQLTKVTLLPPRADGTRQRKQMGDRAAEAVEEAFGLGRGWFDSEASFPGRAPAPPLNPSIDPSEPEKTATGEREEIPVSAEPTPENLKRTLWLLASLLADLPEKQREAVMGFAGKVGKDPRDSYEWIEMAGACMASIPKGFQNPRLGDAMEMGGLSSSITPRS